MSLPTDSMARKGTPVFYGFLNYFPDAVAEVARLSLAANDKHNPGEPLHWSKEKSNDHADCLVRHLLEHGEIDPDDGFSHTVKVAWRAMALLQMELEAKAEPKSGHDAIVNSAINKVFEDEYERRQQVTADRAEEHTVQIRINNAARMGLTSQLQGVVVPGTYDPKWMRYRSTFAHYDFRITPHDLAEGHAELVTPEEQS